MENWYITGVGIMYVNTFRGSVASRTLLGQIGFH